MPKNGIKESVINYLGWSESRVAKAFLRHMYFEG